MKALARLVSAAALIGVISGCSASLHIGGPSDSGPTCLSRQPGRPSEMNGTLVLVAQSVQTASRVPCLRALPAGWGFHSFDARRGQSRIALDLGRAYDNALVVTLTADCDVRGAARTNTDRADTRRYEAIRSSATDYTGRRFYLFTGGCLTFRFDVRGSEAAVAAQAAARSIGVIPRAELRSYVRLYSRGRFDLDPAPGS